VKVSAEREIIPSATQPPNSGPAESWCTCTVKSGERGVGSELDGVIRVVSRRVKEGGVGRSGSSWFAPQRRSKDAAATNRRKGRVAQRMSEERQSCELVEPQPGLSLTISSWCRRGELVEESLIQAHWPLAAW